MATTQALRLQLKDAWIKACEAEGIPVDSKFVVFGKTPEATAYNTLAREFFGEAKVGRNAINPRDRHENRVPTTGPRRLKRITSHAGYARFLATVEDTDLVIDRISSILTPYSSGPEHVVYALDSGKLVFIAETAHKQYDVFEVPSTAQTRSALEAR